MKTHLFIKNTIRFTCIALMLLSVSCVSRTPQLNYQEIIRAALALEMDIELKDNHRLYIEASQWMGTPYKYGGNTKAGIDCSGLTCQLYRKVFKKRLKRTANEQRLYNCRYVSKMRLK